MTSPAGCAPAAGCLPPPVRTPGPAPRTTGSAVPAPCGGATPTPPPIGPGSARAVCRSPISGSSPKATAATHCSGHAEVGRHTSVSDMDMISDAIGSVRAGRANGRRISESGAWGVRFPGFVGIGFHVVLHGQGWLIAEGIEPALLRPGDVVVAPNGAEHGLCHAPAPLEVLPAMTMPAEPPGPRPADFAFLCGAYRLDRGPLHPFLRAMPNVIVVTPDYDGHPELRSLAGLLEDDVAEARPGNWVTRSALVDLLLVHVLRQCSEETGPAGRPAVTAPALVAALGAIHGDPRHRWTVQQLAKVAGMSRTAFSRRFTAVGGKPPSN